MLLHHWIRKRKILRQKLNKTCIDEKSCWVIGDHFRCIYVVSSHVMHIRQIFVCAPFQNRRTFFHYQSIEYKGNVILLPIPPQSQMTWHFIHSYNGIYRRCTRNASLTLVHLFLIFCMVFFSCASSECIFLCLMTVA